MDESSSSAEKRLLLSVSDRQSSSPTEEEDLSAATTEVSDEPPAASASKHSSATAGAKRLDALEPGVAAAAAAVTADSSTAAAASPAAQPVAPVKQPGSAPQRENADDSRSPAGEQKDPFDPALPAVDDSRDSTLLLTAVVRASTTAATADNASNDDRPNAAADDRSSSADDSSDRSDAAADDRSSSDGDSFVAATTTAAAAKQPADSGEAFVEDDSDDGFLFARELRPPRDDDDALPELLRPAVLPTHFDTDTDDTFSVESEKEADPSGRRPSPLQSEADSDDEQVLAEEGHAPLISSPSFAGPGRSLERTASFGHGRSDDEDEDVPLAHHRPGDRYHRLSLDEPRHRVSFEEPRDSRVSFDLGAGGRGAGGGGGASQRPSLDYNWMRTRGGSASSSFARPSLDLYGHPVLPSRSTETLASSLSIESDENGLYNVDLPHFQHAEPALFVENFVPSGKPFPPGIVCVDYSPDQLVRTDLQVAHDLAHREPWVVVRWIIVPELRAAVEVIHELGAAYGLHPVSVEDALSVPQRPKVDEFDDYLYVACRMLCLHGGRDAAPGGGLSPTGGTFGVAAEEEDPKEKLRDEQVSIFLLYGVVISIFEGTQAEEAAWCPVLDLLERFPDSKLRNRGASFLAYSLLRQLTAAFLHISEKYFQEVSQLQQLAPRSSSYDVVVRTLNLIRELELVRQLLRPMRDVLSSFVLTKNRALVRRETTVYLQDSLHDLVHALDVIETYKDIGLAVRDQSLNTVGLKTINVTWFLTVISILFMPATIIAGAFSFNFQDPLGGPATHVPYVYGYPLFFVGTLGIMLFTLVAMRLKGFL